MEAANIQVRFFQQLKQLLPAHIALVDAIADLLDISNDSAYRRIRGEKALSLEELEKLAVHYNISLDELMHVQGDSFLFTGKLGNDRKYSLDDWLSSILGNFIFLNSFPNKHLYYLTRDITFVEHFQFPELAAFKFFFWKKSIFQYEDMKSKKFSLDAVDEKASELGRKTYEQYLQVPMTEIWNIESINTTIRQIEFYREAHLFDSFETINILYQKIDQLLDHLERQAEYGHKFPMGKEPAINAAPYNMYVNELILGDNSFLAVTDSLKIAFISHSVLDYIITRDQRFCEHKYASIQNLIKKSTAVSQVGEKERTRFFNRLRDKIRLVSKL